MSDSPNRDAVIFTEAAQLPAGERAAYLEKACGGNAVLRQKVEALLQTYDHVGDFLEASPQKASIEARAASSICEKEGDRIGRYKLLQQIGEGGWGVVFMAEQDEPVRRKVALKVVKPGMDTKNVIARFEAERQALALMDHSNIARVFDAGTTENGRPYFVMELVRGTKITDYCDESRVPTADRLELFIQVCHAVQHAHQKGIIHRDIKPSNILVTTSAEGKPLPKVIDFGIAKATNGLRLTDKTLFTAFEMLIGTPAYMSPEQAAFTSVDVDTRTDIYSLGVLLYELLTSTTPFDTKALLKSGLDEIRRVIREEEPAPPSTRLSRMEGETLTIVAQYRASEPPRLIRAIRGDLDWIAMKAMEKDRARRYQTASDLALDVKHFLENEPVSARPPSSCYRVQKVMQRHRLLSVGIGIIATSLVVSLIVVSASLSREQQSQREAKQVKQFLEDMLRGVGPNVALGRDTTILREILGEAAARVGTELTNQPAVEAELRGIIGALYFRTGQLQLAEKMQRTVLAIRQKRFGPESLETATALNDLGLTLMADGKLSEAEQVNREALDIRQRCFGNDNAEVAASQNNLAHVYSQIEKLTEGKALAHASLATRQKLFGNDSLEAADSLRTLAVISGDERQWSEAEAISRKVLEIRRKKLGLEHPWVASALDDLAWAAGANGKQKEAEALERESLAMRQKLLSPGHPDLAKSLYLVGDRMRQEGNSKEAYSVLSAALSVQRKVLGEDHPSTIRTLKSLGFTYEGDHNWAEAETIFREALSLSRKHDGNEGLETLYTLRDLADVLEYQSRWSEAEALHREGLASWRKRAGVSDPETLYTLHKLGVAISAQGKWSQAETVYREEIALRRKLAGNDDPNTLYAVRNLGEVLECEGHWAEAESMHREELASWRKRAGNDDPQTLYALHKLGWSLEGEGKWPEAESVYRETLASRRDRRGNDDPQTLSEYEKLTRVLMQQNKFGETEQFLAEALTPAAIKQPSSCNLLIWRLTLMGRQGRWQEAAAATSLVVEYQPVEQYRYHNLAALLAITQNRPAYEILCRKILATCTNTSDGYLDERIAEDCLFLPGWGANLELMDKLANKSVSLGLGSTDAPFFQVVKALSAYRLGHYAEAVEWAEKTAKSSIVYVNARAYAILAMARWQLGEKDTARLMLAKGNSLMPNDLHSHKGVDLGDPWMGWLEAQISVDEAKQLISLKAETK